MASSKRDFNRAFDIPVGFQGDNVAAEPQERYFSPMRRIPGQWPDDYDYTDETVAPTPPVSVFTTLARFATSLTLEVFKIPQRLRQRFTGQQQILVLPVIREDGASKRRLVDAGLAPATPKRNLGASGRSYPDVTHGPKLWVESPSPSPPSPQYLGDVDGDDIDDSIDWSMEDVDSGTPSHNPKTGSPSGINWLRHPDRKVLTPKTRNFSPNTSQPAVHRYSPVTPMRKQLLKKQLRALEAVANTPPSKRHIKSTPTSPIRPFSFSNPEAQIHEIPVDSINAHATAAIAQEASTHYKAELEAREKRAAEARALPAQGFPHPANTIDIDLSNLPDAGDVSSSFDSQLSTPPQGSRKKTIRWAPQGRVKTYYVDERISEMLDSTLESIRSPIPKPKFEDGDDDGKAESNHPVAFTEPDSASDSEESVDGPPLEDKDPSIDDSLEESELSKELLSDLEEDFKNLLAQQPPPPPPPKPLIAPLTDDERNQLDAIAAKSDNGKNKAFPIVPDKISARDFGTLLPYQFDGSSKAWLNDEIVNQYLAVIIKTLNDDCGFVYKRGGPAPPYHAFSSHWFTSINSGVKKVERWAGRVGLGGKQFLDAKVVLFPICDGSHWRLLAVKPQERTIEYLDSLGWNGSTYVGKLREYLQNELKGLYKADEWTVVGLQRSERQMNGSDCGVFVLLNALVVVRGEDTKKVVACNGMLQARERIAMTVISGNAVELDY